MAASAFDISTGGPAPQDSIAITVGAGEAVVVRLNRYDADCRAAVVITGGGVETEHDIDRDVNPKGVIIPAVVSGYTAKVRVWRRGDASGGVRGIIEGAAV